jgi:hypothetical protein
MRMAGWKAIEELAAEPSVRHGVPVPLLALLLSAATGALGCNQRSDERAEARQLITSLNAISDEGSLAKRSAALHHLEDLPLHVESHVQTREVCRAAHQALLDAETAQAEARRALSESTTAGGRQTEVIAADIERSNRAIKTAKQRFPECEQAMRKLLRSAH